jgi:hypothetical protein
MAAGEGFHLLGLLCNTDVRKPTVTLAYGTQTLGLAEIRSALRTVHTRLPKRV